jgi:hypothetical protein
VQESELLWPVACQPEARITLRAIQDLRDLAVEESLPRPVRIPLRHRGFIEFDAHRLPQGRHRGHALLGAGATTVKCHILPPVDDDERPKAPNAVLLCGYAVAAQVCVALPVAVDCEDE